MKQPEPSQASKGQTQQSHAAIAVGFNLFVYFMEEGDYLFNCDGGFQAYTP